MSRRKLSKYERLEVYNKMDGHCAYCGCELPFEKMQVDHIVSLYGHNGADELENMYPACRSCNHYKHSLTLEDYRAMLEKMPQVLARDSVTYKNAVRFGLVIPNPKKVVFYFEREEQHSAKSDTSLSHL